MTNIYRPLSQKLLMAAGETLPQGYLVPGQEVFLGTFESGNLFNDIITEIEIPSIYWPQIDEENQLEIRVDWLRTQSANFPQITGERPVQLDGGCRPLDADGNIIPQPSNATWIASNNYMTGFTTYPSVTPLEWLTGPERDPAEADKLPAGTRSLRINAGHLNPSSSTFALAIQNVYLEYPIEYA